MKYSELLQFSPVEAAVRLGDADQEGGARRLVSTFVLSPALAGQLTAQAWPALQLERPADARMVLVTGPHGVGKSHLLAVLSALAERGELADALPRHDLLSGLAGRFRVLRLTLGPQLRALREIVLDQCEAFATAQGTPYTFPRAARLPRHRPAFDDLLLALRQKYPEQGLLLVLDDLLEFLKGRRTRDLALDLEFLRELGEAGAHTPLRVLAAVQEAMFEHAEHSLVADGLQRLQRRCVEVKLDASAVHAVVAALIVRKSPEQRARVEQHLARFADCYGDMRERLAEFVDLYPLHPDFAPLFEQNVFAERRGVLRTLADAVAKRLEHELAADEPGFVAYDSYWEMLKANPVCRKVPEIAAVIDFSALLEARLEQSDATRPEDRALARRIIHALSIQRLAVGDVYCGRGVTPAQLRDGLGLFPAGFAPGDEVPRDALLARVVQVLEEIRASVQGPLINVRSHEGQYHLHFKKFRRFHAAEVALHWINAVPFLLLMATGALMLASRFSHLDRQLLGGTVGLHKLCALVWFLAMPLAVFTRLKPHWANIRTLLTWGAGDAVWMIQSLRSLYNKKAVIPPADRFNTGQKINACLVIVYYFGFADTGLLMYWKGSILFPWYIHTALFCGALGSVGGHLYLALVNPSTRIALGGIFHGWAPMKYIEHHHALSLPRSLRAHAKPASIRALAEEVWYSRMEMVILVITLLLAGAGAYAFGLGRVATIKKQFEKSFADVIQPSELSTKHRIGPTAESCTKCHDYAGEIPDRKCEACHEDVKARRDARRGFHGSLKGDCRFCHREHRERSATLVPLDRDTFNHNEAVFSLTGKHAQVKCDDCHKKPRPEGTPGIYYLGVPHASCTDCHRDQHRAQFTNACTSCHSPAGWTGAAMTFRHETGSDFALEGRHAQVACAKCHQPPAAKKPLGDAKFKGLPRTCAECHEDPHRKQFATRCTDCHSPAGWKRPELDFNHDVDSKYPLVAKHAQVACEKCHTPAKPGDPLGRAQFKGLKTGCADCHQDPHGGQFKRACTTCHTGPQSWQVTAPLFEHDRDTAFPLRDKHAAVRCVLCHQPPAEGGTLASAKFKGLATACDQCHPIQHPEPYGPTCTACHSPAAWPRKQTPLDHQRQFGFELAGKHRTTKCSACHTTALLGVRGTGPRTAFTCATCHQQNDPHQGSLGNDCAKCHSPTGWKGEDLLFDHNTMARFALDRDHEDVACAKCHQAGRWKPLDTACASCHTKFFLERKP